MFFLARRVDHRAGIGQEALESISNAANPGLVYARIRPQSIDFFKNQYPEPCISGHSDPGFALG
jgi:hypothetical protein